MTKQVRKARLENSCKVSNHVPTTTDTPLRAYLGDRPRGHTGGGRRTLCVFGKIEGSNNPNLRTNLTTKCLETHNMQQTTSNKSV